MEPGHVTTSYVREGPRNVTSLAISILSHNAMATMEIGKFQAIIYSLTMRYLYYPSY